MKAKKGIYAAAITPIGADGEPDADKLVVYCRRLMDAGLDGVAPFGTTGEGNSMPFRVRIAVAEKFAAAGFGADEVLLGTGASSVGDAVELTRASVDAGLTNVLMLPPFYYKAPSEDGLYAYYARIIDQVGDDDLRIYLYHFPQTSAVPITVALASRLRADFGAVVAGLKDSSGDFENSKSYVAAIPDFDVFPSTEALLLAGREAGMAGVISATTNVSPTLAHRTLRASGAEADALQARLADVRKTVSSYPLIPATRQAVAWLAGDGTLATPLPPLGRLTAEQTAGLKADIERLNEHGDLMTPVRETA